MAVRSLARASRRCWGAAIAQGGGSRSLGIRTRVSSPECTTLPRSLCTTTAVTGPRSGVAPAPIVSVVDQAEASAPVHTVGYFTDVEGHSTYLDSCVDKSEAISWADPDTRTTLTLHDGCMFVYGGDAFDKGCSDLRIATALADLRERHPDRVFLLIGNRDLNKMKFTSELAPSDTARPAEEIPGPYWIRSGTSLRQFLLAQWAEEEGVSVEQLEGRGKEVVREGLAARNTEVNRLRYYHTKQMGCFFTFEHRRRELRRASGREDISDEEVFESFRSSVLEAGPVRRYLENAQLAVVIGDTLFVHGAVNSLSMGFVPDANVVHDRLATGLPPGAEMKDTHSVQEWITELNRYARAGIDDWIRQPEWDDTRTRRGGQALMGYGYRPAMQGRTAMVQSYMNEWQHPEVPEADVAEYLTASRVHRVVAGHQPFGDSPLLMRMPRRRLEVVTADTSFSDPSPASHEDTRGPVAGSVHIRDPLAVGASTLHLAGCRHDGTRYHFSAPAPGRGHGGHEAVLKGAGAGAVEDALVGLETDDGWWVKARLAASGGAAPEYVLSKGEGFDVHYRHVTAEELIEAVADGSTLDD